MHYLFNKNFQDNLW